MKYFVTGGTGFLGGYLVKQLLAQGDQVVALVRDPSQADSLKDLGAYLVKGDITKKETMRGAMEGVDGLFHIAGWYKVGVDNPDTAFSVNVDGTRNVLELMDELAIPKGVYTSTLTVHSDTKGQYFDEGYVHQGEHLSLYDQTKAIAHHQVAKPMMDAGLPLIIVQPGAIYGPGDTSAIGHSFRDFLKGDLPMLPKEAAVCWGHVEDIARAHILAMEKGKSGESYIIAGPCHTFVEAFDLAARITGKAAPTIKLPAWLLRAAAVPMTVVEKFVPLPPEYTPEGLRVLAGTTYFGDNSKAKRELGYEPRSLEEGLRQALSAYQAEVNAQRE